jgi:hypothetical protein
MADRDILDQAKDDFKRCYDAESTQRKASQDDLDFAILGKQWPEDVVTQREKEGRPCLTINRLPAFLKQVTNDSRQNRPNIEVKPTGDGASVETARIQNDLIRNIWTTSQGDVVVDTALDFATAMGFGYGWFGWTTPARIRSTRTSCWSGCPTRFRSTATRIHAKRRRLTGTSRSSRIGTRSLAIRPKAGSGKTPRSLKVSRATAKKNSGTTASESA